MGTSASNSGPSDKTPLLPDWAQGSPAPPPAGPPPDASPDGAVPDQGASDPPGQPQEAPAPAGADNVPAQAPSRGPWSLARRAMTSVARAGGGARRFGVAGGRYVRAKGGAKSAAASSAAGRATTAGLVLTCVNQSSNGWAPLGGPRPWSTQTAQRFHSRHGRSGRWRPGVAERSNN